MADILRASLGTPLVAQVKPRRAHRMSTSPRLLTKVRQAMEIATRYQDRVPAPSELQAAYGLSRATAYRYVACLRDVRGGAANA